MGILNFLGSNPIEAIGKTLDAITTTDEERDAARITMAKLVAESDRLQTELNKAEIQHRSMYVAGWRPLIGYVAGISLAIYFIPQFIIGTYLWAVQCINVGEVVPYPISADGLLELTLGMLGIATLRTIEKLNGKTK